MNNRIENIHPYETQDNIGPVITGETKFPGNKNAVDGLKDDNILTQSKPTFGQRELFSQLNTLKTGDKLTQKNNIENFLTKNQADIDAFVGSDEYHQLLKDARVNYNSKNKEVAIKTNFALQVYARYELGDQEIAVDGQSGPKTLTVLRFIQVEGIGGDPVNIQLTPEQKQKIDQYRTYRSGRILERSILVRSTKSVSSVSTPKSTNEISSNTQQSTILSQNKGIETSINNLPKPATDWIQTDGPILDRSEIRNIVTANITDTSLVDPYVQYIANKQKGERPVGVSDNLDKSIQSIIDKESEKKKQSVSGLCQKESYLSCIKGFEGLLKNFTNKPIEKESWIKVLENKSDINFDNVELSVTINIDGEDVRFRYDIETGQISANALIYKDPATNDKITTQKGGTFYPLIRNIPNRSGIEKTMQLSVNKSIQNKKLNINDFASATAGVTEAFDTSLINDTNKNTINKTIQSSYLSIDLLKWIQEHTTPDNARKEFTQRDNSDLYKTFDIVYRTIQKYGPEDIVTLRSKLQNIYTISQKYQEKGSIADERSSHLNKDALIQDSTKANGSYGLYMLLTQCTRYSGPGDNYRVMDLTEIDKLINYDTSTGQKGFGPITHHEILSHEDRTIALQEADKLLESAYS